MQLKKSTLLLIAYFCINVCMAQCSLIGGSPTGALPVCDNNFTDTQGAPVGCGSFIVVHGCPNIYTANFPYWYKFKCYKSGSLGFEITPTNIDDQYDWELFDITGHSPQAVTSQDLGVKGNWSGSPGPTGAVAGGAVGTICVTPPSANLPSFSSMPILATDHTYLLLVAHHEYPPPIFPGGYTMAFKGGNADIEDPAEPHAVAAATPCAGGILTVKFSKKLKCETIDLYGSEFVITPPLATVMMASGVGCGYTFETDSVRLTLDTPLPPGNYTVGITTGSDGNTVSDFCNHFIADGESVPFVIPPVVIPHMDSIAQPGCAPSELQLIFKKPIRCASIHFDGSQFLVTGPAPVTVVGAKGAYCAGGNAVTNFITVTLSAPLGVKGTYQVKVATGTGGIRLGDECGMTVANGETVTFAILDTVSAEFGYDVHLGCKHDTIDFFHPGGNDITLWNWTFDGVRTSTLQSPRMFYDTFGLKRVQLIVSNGGCSDTSIVNILLDNELNADFETLSMVCPGQLVTFKDSSVGQIVSRLWTFGNGNSSTLKSPPQQSYLVPSVNTTVIAKLVITDRIGCISTATKKIILADICYVYVPGAFTPNNDGLNDYLYPLNVFNSSGFQFKVFNRYGQVMFESADPSNRWNGRFKGQVADPGAYIWTLQYVDNKSGKTIGQRGSTILIR